MRRSASATSCEASQPGQSGGAPHLHSEALEDLEDASYDQEDGSPVPQRKGTLSKDLRGVAQYVPRYTMHTVMNKLSLVGLIFGTIPPLCVIAFVTGNLHRASFVVAVVNGVSTILLSVYRMLNYQRETERGILMCGLALYLTVPLFVCSIVTWYLTGGNDPQITI